MNSSEASLVLRIERTIRQEHLFAPGAILVVALSGGADSTALLDLLSRLPGYNLRLVAAHLNHSLRGEESDGDEAFCRELAARYAVPFEVRRVDVRRMADEGRLNLEDAGRRARIEFLDEIRRKYGAGAVALAHHADDQAETVLMRLLRGSGITGLSGMAYRNERGYVRPLLDITRSELLPYLCLRGLEWREDASNSDTTYLRNRIRHQLLPLLEGYNPAIRSCLASTASMLRDDEAMLCELTGHDVAVACTIGAGEIVCSVGQLRMLDPARRRRVLRHAIKQLDGTLAGVTRCHIDALDDVITSARPNSQVALPRRITAVREYDRLLFVAGTAEHRLNATAASEHGFELTITGPDSYQLPWGGSLYVEVAGVSAVPGDSGAVCFNLDEIPFPWLVRAFRPGDRMTPLGMSGRKKVKDIFIDRKIPRSERRMVPLLWHGEDLIWIAGVCASALCHIDSSALAPVRVTWRR
jgi:tRNA(Ile)-lysidine synthase